MADTPEPLSEYEQARNEKIARNRAFLAALGLGDAQSPQQARPVVRRPDTPEVVERPKASQDVVDALAKRYPSRRKEASLLVSALRAPGDAPMIVTGQESGPVTCEAASQCGLAVARVKCSSDETGSKLLERCAVAADGKSDRVSAESLARRLDAAALAAPLSRGVVILEDGDRLLSRRAGDEGATALRRLCAACRLADTAPRLCITGDDRALSQVSQRLRDPVRIHLRDNATTTSLTQALCDSEEPLFRDFCRAVATAAKRETSDIGHLAKLTRSAPLFDLYKTQQGGAAGYDAIRPVLTTAIPRLRDPELDVDALCRGDVSTSVEEPAPETLLLLAAYVSSRTRPEDDQQLFGHDPQKKKRRKKRDVTKVRVDAPKAVQLDRLLAVYARLREEHGSSLPDVRDDDVLRTLSDLVDQNALERASGIEDLANPRFLCLLDAGQAYDLASLLGLPLGRYLPG